MSKAVPTSVTKSNVILGNKPKPNGKSSQIPICTSSLTSAKWKATFENEADANKSESKYIPLKIPVAGKISKQKTASEPEPVMGKSNMKQTSLSKLYRALSDKCTKNVDKPKQKCANRGLPICDKSEVNVNDVGLYYKDIKKLSDGEIYNLMVNRWKPSKGFDFPLSTESAGKKHLLHEYLKECSWLAYSKYLDGCFCISCLLFGGQTGHHDMAHLKKLFTETYTYWTSACSRFKDHESHSPLHQDSVLIMENFCQRVGKQQMPVIQIAN